MNFAAPALKAAMAGLEVESVRWLDEVARKAEEGDIQYLQKVGQVFQAVHQ